MRHPLRGLALQGSWYTLGNVLVKLGGLALLPLYANTKYLSISAFGLWGVLEVTAHIAVAVLGLQMISGLMRYYPESEQPHRMLATTWWTTVFIALTAWGLSAALFPILFSTTGARLYLLLATYVAFEMLLAVPLMLLRIQGHAFHYTVLAVVKLGLLILLNVLLLVTFRRGLIGLLEAFVGASGATLVGALLLTGPSNYLRLSFSWNQAKTLLRFSVPLVMAALSSFVLLAGDRYVLKVFSTNEELALYTMAAKFGGVVNMFGVQPLSLAFLPMLFRLAEHQRVEVLRLVMRYLVAGFGLLVVGLALFTEPVLHLLQTDPYYFKSAVLVPWIALGFAALGLSIPMGGALGLFERTGVASGWVLGAAVLNLLLNLALVPRLDALGAAVATLAAYGALFAGRFYSADRLMPVPYAWSSIFGILAVTAGIAFTGSSLPLPDHPLGWLLRAGLLVLWGGMILLARWITLEDLRRAWETLRPAHRAAPPNDLQEAGVEEPV